MHSCVFRSYCSSSAIGCAIQKRLKLLSTVCELAGTYWEPSQDLRGLYLQLADTISSQLPYSSRCATSLDSKIRYCSSTTNHPADYFVDEAQITILDFTFYHSKFTTYRQLEITIQSPGGVADPQFVIFKWWPLRYFACSCIATFPRIAEQRVDRTRPQSGCSVYR